MYPGKHVFSQVMEHLSLHTFHQCVNRYRDDFKVQQFFCLDQYLWTAFAQLAYRESLRDIEVCLRAQKNKLYHMGICSSVSRNNLAYANKARAWRIYSDLARTLIQTARKLYASDSFALELDSTVYALDATTIELCMSMFLWANFRRAKGAIKLHTLLDLWGNIPNFIHISDGKLHEVNALDILPLEAGAFYVMDRGYLDLARLYAICQHSVSFVNRAKSNLKCRRVYSHQIDRSTGLICDQSVMLTRFYQCKDYPDKLRRVKYHDAATGKILVFLANNFSLQAMAIADLYRSRWQVELFFKWIKQNLLIKTFYGTSENAV
ncbi:MAG: IS4 family transposase [Bacteroidetes bacterium]|nr:MAG: IS4 family transposase [Bacteroidota bacterium]